MIFIPGTPDFPAAYRHGRPAAKNVCNKTFRSCMKVKKVICAAGRSGYMHRDLMAIKAGARQDGMIFHGPTVTPGFKKIVEPATIISLMLVLEDGQIAIGDCADVILAGVAGRDPVFNAGDYMEVMQGPVTTSLTG